ncbi:transcription factor bHLH125-like, partial [Olea europaea var. sylvestris]|uniref:transcription factor bHLH125-like n=1 Tax=Olea europaea var. sylvestris TaxID=158386 RepID=UPI000C1D4873
MFSLQQGYELVFQSPLVYQSDQILQDLTMDHSLNTSSGEKGKQKSVSIQENKGERTLDESYIRKLVHRDIERQRRQEMTKLYASLRSLVPPEYLKGKRSISDHMQEAINYIRDMKNNIRELQIRRDKLKKFSNSGNLSAEVGSSTCYSTDSVMVNPCLDGMEIVISCSFKLGMSFDLRALRN